MASNSQSINDMKRILFGRGEKAQKNARQLILNKFCDKSQISQALRYFSNNALKQGMAVFPSLVSLSYEAAGGTTFDVTAIGEAIVMVTGAADIHDDVIDQSLLKNSKKTVLGKFGKEVAILAGDTLLVEGMTRLFDAMLEINVATRKTILELVSSAVFEISNSETLEFRLRRNRYDLGSTEFSKIIKQKAVVPELAMKIGACLADGNSKLVNCLGEYGRAFGFVSTVVDEFVDVLDTDELVCRLKNECPPLPLVYLMENQRTRGLIWEILCKLPDDEAEQKLVAAINESLELCELRNDLTLLAKSKLKEVEEISKGKIIEELETIILAPLAYLTDLFPLTPSSGPN